MYDTYLSMKHLLDCVNTVKSDKAKSEEERIEEVKKLLEQANQLPSKFGEDKELYSQLVYSVADFLIDNDQDDEALELFYQHLNLCEELYGPDSIRSVDSLCNIGSTYLFANPAKALDFFMKALTIREAHPDANQSDTMNNYLIIGFAYKFMGNTQLAIDYFKKAQEVSRNLGNMEEVFKTQRSIAEAYESKGLHKEAIQNYHKMLEIASSMEDEDVDIAHVYNAIGKVWLAAEDLQRALENVTKAAEIAEKEQGYFSEETGTYYYNAGVISLKMNDLQHLLEHSDKALEIREKLLEDDDPDLAETYLMCGLAQAWKKDIPNALHYLQKSLNINEDWFGSDSEEVKTISDIMDSITQYGIENHESLTALLKDWGDEHLN